MAPSDEDDFPPIGHKCVEICNTLVNQKVAFKFSLTFGTFSFSLDTTGMRSSPAQLPQKKRKSPGAINRDKRRRMEFLKRKDAASSPSAPQPVPDISSSLGTGIPSHVDSRGAAATQRDTLDTDLTNTNTLGLKYRVEKSALGKWSISPSLSRRNSSSDKPDPVPGKNVTKSPQTQPECRNCHQPFLLNHQCDENYYWDDDDEFGNDSDGSDDSAKHWRHNEAVKCKCDLHSRLMSDNSPQPKKPRNSWRQKEYPDDCRLNLLRAGKIKIPEK